MKLYILAFSIVLTGFISNINAQENINSFAIEEGKLIWQKVYETDLGFDELLSVTKESGLFQIVEVSDDKILAEVKSINADFKGAGYSEMSTPMYVSRSFIEGFVKIEFKQGRYRISIKNIMLIQKYDDGVSKEGEKSSLESFAIKKGNIMKKPFTKSPSKILDYTFTKEFNLKAKTKTDNW